MSCWKNQRASSSLSPFFLTTYLQQRAGSAGGRQQGGRCRQQRERRSLAHSNMSPPGANSMAMLR
jgi:hypothetical protein